MDVEIDFIRLLAAVPSYHFVRSCFFELPLDDIELLEVVRLVLAGFIVLRGKLDRSRASSQLTDLRVSVNKGA